MKLIRYNDPLSTQLRAFNNWFGRPFAGGLGSLDRLFDVAQGLSGSPVSSGGGQLAADLYEDNDHYYARLEMPGIEKDVLKVSLDERVLTVAFENASEDDGGEQTSSNRSLTVPDGIDAAKVSAELKDGILTVTLPKAEELKPRQIKVS